MLFIYGDRPESGRRSDDLTVKAMISEARAFSDRHLSAPRRLQTGVASQLAAVPPWKQSADFLFAQAGFSLESLLRWRAAVDFAGPVYAGVLVLASAQMARKLSATVPQLAVPEHIVAQVERDRSAGVEIGCQMVCDIRDSGAFEGVHLISVGRYREVARRLEELL
jgi:5,10-methylenetetrahydrofolate reductase